MKQSQKMFRLIGKGRHILLPVMTMKDSKQILTTIIRTTQMGRNGIRAILPASMRPGLRKTLQTQLLQYDAIETEALSIASQRGWELPESDPGLQFLSRLMTKTRLAYGNADSKIADMMIQDNTRRMVRCLKDMHQSEKEDPQVGVLSQRLLDCQSAGIRQLQSFL